ncbi:MAG: HIT domain-containing protein [Isosphaeraceae bacterium]
MERLWAPWRAQYIQAAPSPRVDTDGPACFLCRGLAGSDDRASLLAWRGESSAVFLNRYPYNNGHLLVCPVEHTGNLARLTDASLHDTMETVRRMMGVLDRMLGPQGYNVGLNQGRAAGAGLPDHLHWHIVPRWDGDANFMPVLADTKVLIESLDAFYDRLVAELAGPPRA